MNRTARIFAAAALTVLSAAPVAADDSFCVKDTAGEPGGSFVGYANLIYSIADMTNVKLEFDAYSVGPEAGQHPLKVTKGHTLIKTVIDGQPNYAMYNNETTIACDITKDTFDKNRPVNAPVWGIK